VVFKVPMILPVFWKLYIRNMGFENVLEKAFPSLHEKAIVEPKL